MGVTLYIYVNNYKSDNIFSTKPIVIMINKRIVFTVVSCLWIFGGQAQYIPGKAKQRKKISSIKVAANQQDTLRQPIVYCDTLILEESASLVVAPYIKSFTLYAQYCKFGKNSRIAGNGLNGKSQVAEPIQGEWGQNAAQLNLYLNIYSLEHLIIEANGGNGANGKVPGIYGAGGNVHLSYYAPFVVNVSKKYRQRKRKSSIQVSNKTGVMNTRKLQKLIEADFREKANTNNPNLKHNVSNIVANQQNPSLPFGASNTPTENKKFKELAKMAEKEKNARKKGKISLNRYQNPLLLKDVK